MVVESQTLISCTESRHILTRFQDCKDREQKLLADGVPKLDRIVGAILLQGREEALQCPVIGEKYSKRETVHSHPPDLQILPIHYYVVEPEEHRIPVFDHIVVHQCCGGLGHSPRTFWAV